MKRWLNRREIKPALAISLMNVGFKFLSIPQIVYLHQSFAVADYRDLRLFEVRARLYRLVKRLWIRTSIKKDTIIIVQTKWMKPETINRFHIEGSRVLVFRPKTESQFNVKLPEKNGYSYELFYPSTAAISYKNHELLIKVLHEISKSHNDLFSHLKIIFTTDISNNKLTRYYYRLSRKLGVSDHIAWVGYLSKKSMLGRYAMADMVLFPSRLETFGLPLLEAASLGKAILVLDKPYAHDVLEGYAGVRFLEDDPTIWTKCIEESYSTGKKLDFKPFVEQTSNGWKNFVDLAIESTESSLELALKKQRS